MSIELTGAVEEQLKDLAVRTGRDVRTLAEEAIRQYLDGLSITDLDPGDVAKTQGALVSELRDIPEWKGRHA